MNIYVLIGVPIVCFLITTGVLLLLKYKRRQGNTYELFVKAGRDIGYVTGTLSLTATYVSAVFVNGTAGTVYSNGFLHTQMLWGYVVSLILGGFLFARKFHDAGYTTILDPLQEVYGKIMTSVLYLPITLAEILWIASIISSMNSSLTVEYQGNSKYISIVVALLVVSYMLAGGFHSVVYANGLQFLLLFVGLWITVPYLMLSDLQKRIVTSTSSDWVGVVQDEDIGPWLDMLLVMSLGGVTWQMYFLHISSTQTSTHARVISFSAAIGCLICMIPLTFIGAVAKLPDWDHLSNSSNVTSGIHPSQDIAFVLPVTLQQLTPTWVYLVVLGVVIIVAMSSIDTLTLSSSVMFSNNIYRHFRIKASASEHVWVTRAIAVMVISISTALGLTIQDINKYWTFLLELIYILIFPHLLAAMYISSANVYGSIAAAFIGLLLRVCAGVSEFGLPTIIEYPFYDTGKQRQIFPFRTFTMCISLLVLLVVSVTVKRFLDKYKAVVDQDEIDIIRISYREPERERVTSFSKIGGRSGSYNSIAASANDIRHSKSDEHSLLKVALGKHHSNASSRYSDPPRRSFNE